MRALGYAAIFGVVLMAAGVAAADPWTDPAGRFTLDVPHGWRVQVISSTGHTYIKVGSAERECQMVATPDPATAAQNAGVSRLALQNDAQFSQAWWTDAANTINTVFPNNSAQFVSRSSDTAAFWPVQRADFTSPGHIGDPPLPISTVHAGFTMRPGMQIVGLCYTVSDPDYPTPDNPSAFDPILRSMGTANDAQLQTDAQTYDAALQQVRAQQAAAQAASAQHQQQQGQHH